MAARQGAGARAGCEAGQVRAMFDRIAGVYDLMNTAMTRRPAPPLARRAAADLARVGPGSRVLDVATGTGDLALELARARRAGRRGRRQRLRRGDARPRPREGRRRPRAGGAARASNGPTRWRCPTPTTRFDAATVGFGARNFEDLGRGLAEMARVVRPGGRVVVLEITTPTRPPLSLFYRLWFDRLVPALGRLAGALARTLARAAGATAGTAIADAYTYLPNSVKRFPGPAALAARWSARGSRRSLRAHRRRDRRDPRRHRRGARAAGERGRADGTPGRTPQAVDGLERDHAPRRRRRCASGWRAPSATSSA